MVQPVNQRRQNGRHDQPGDDGPDEDDVLLAPGRLSALPWQQVKAPLFLVIPF